jgi:hypothetical protein
MGRIIPYIIILSYYHINEMENKSHVPNHQPDGNMLESGMMKPWDNLRDGVQISQRWVHISSSRHPHLRSGTLAVRGFIYLNYQPLYSQWILMIL